MYTILYYGTIFGAIAGFCHFVQIIASRSGGPGQLPGTLWHALWMWILWTLFGAYVLVLWCIATVLFVLTRPFASRRQTQ